MRGSGENLDIIASTVGISVPTLRKLYDQEIREGLAPLITQITQRAIRKALGAPAEYDAAGNMIRAEQPAESRMIEFILRTKGGFRERAPVPSAGLSHDLGGLDLGSFTDDELAALEPILAAAVARSERGNG